MSSLKPISKFLVACIFCICFSPILFAQIDWSSPILSIDERDGLPSSYIRNFVEDEWGFIWFSSYNNICRFDGSNLEIIDPPELPLEGYSQIAYDKWRKVLWMGHFTGLYSYHIPSGTVKRHTKSKEAGYNQINSIDLDENGTLWFVARSRLGRLTFPGDSVETLRIHIPDLSDITVNELFFVEGDPVRKERIWISSAEGLISYDTSTGVFTLANDWLKPPSKQTINEITVNPYTQRLYFGYNNSTGNINRLNPYYNYSVFDPHTDTFIDAFSLDKSWNNASICAWQDSLVLLTSLNGLAFYNEKTGKVEKVLQPEGESPQKYRADFVDSHKNIWSKSQGGIHIYRSESQAVESHFYPTDHPGWYHIPIDLLYNEKRNSLFQTVLGGEGMYEFGLEDRAWKLYPFKDTEGNLKKTDFSHAAFLKDKGLHILGLKGLYTQNSGGEIVEIPQSEDFFIRGGKSYWDSKGILWVTRGEQVWKIDPQQGTQEDITAFTHFCEPHSGETIYLEDSRSNIWISGFCGGLDRYDRKADTFQSFDLGPAIQTVTFSGIDEYGGYFWAQSEHGDLYKIDVATPEKGVVEVIELVSELERGKVSLQGPKPNGDEFFRGGKFDSYGKFWFFTGRGLYGYDVTKRELIGFDESVGLPLRDPDMNVFTAGLLRRLPDRRMAFVTRKGICLFDPQLLALPEALPTPYIRNLLVNNEPLESDSGAFFTSRYSLGPRENFLGIDFSATDFNKPEGVSFLYKMEGVDEDWKNPGERRYISYSEMKGGDYTFRLKAANSSGVWSPTEAGFQVHIDTFWYQTLWAKVLFILAALGLILGIYFYRLRQAIKKEQEKNRYERNLAEIKMQALTAQMNPHFIFNSLNSIDFYIIKNNTKKASKYLNSFSRLMRLILSNSRSNYVRLADDLEALKLYLEIEALRFNHRFTYEVTLADNIDIDFLQIPPMLIQPYVENSIWHGLLHKKENGKIRIHYSYEEEEEVLTCTVSDNGIGRKKSMELKTQKESDKGRKSFGMNITKDKIEAMKFLHGIDAKVEIEDLYDQEKNSMGTKVELMIPV